VNLFLFAILVIAFTVEAVWYASQVSKAREPVTGRIAAVQVAVDIAFIVALFLWGGTKL
jgi:hypothetical protein